MECRIVIDRDMIEKPDIAAMGLSGYEALSLEEGRELALGELDRVVYMLSLKNGGLRYQVDFIMKNKKVEQWVVIAFTDNPRTAAGFIGLLGKMESQVRLIQVEDGNVRKAFDALQAIPLIRKKTCLIYSKRAYTGKKTAAALLKESCPDWEFEICEGEEDVLEKYCPQVSRVLIMGRSIQDFSLVKPSDTDVSPILLYNRADENVQACINPRYLWRQIQMILSSKKWEFPDDFPKFFVGSLRYEKWNRQAKEGLGESLRLNEEFVMWDESGLPCLREAYTEEAIRTFLAQFDAVSQIGICLRKH